MEHPYKQKQINGRRIDEHRLVMAKHLGRKLERWEFAVSQNKTKHPAVFPIELPLRHIKSWSNENDTVLDPFMGSRTTGIACKKLNRNFIGIELDETYFNIAKNRILDN